MYQSYIETWHVPQLLALYIDCMIPTMSFLIKPAHYSDLTMPFINSVINDMTPEEAIMAFNVIKYVSRFHKKNGMEDLKKAYTYLHEYISSHQEQLP